MKAPKKNGARCESCAYYSYDEEYDCYNCEINLDEDEMEKFLSYSDFNCPYYNPFDEYKIVNRQI